MLFTSRKDGRETESNPASFGLLQFRMTRGGSESQEWFPRLANCRELGQSSESEEWEDNVQQISRVFPFDPPTGDCAQQLCVT